MDDSPEKENQENEEEEFWEACAAAHIIAVYQATYDHKKPCMTSSYTGNEWLRELMGINANPTRCYRMFRMDKTVFNSLMHDLVS